MKPRLSRAATPRPTVLLPTPGNPMSTTCFTFVSIVTQHFFETLYTFGKDWAITPLLAADMPQISADGLTYTIPLRTGIKFHDGSDMDSTDVVASLNRWEKIATRGKQAAEVISGVEAVDHIGPARDPDAPPVADVAPVLRGARGIAVAWRAPVAQPGAGEVVARDPQQLRVDLGLSGS